MKNDFDAFFSGNAGLSDEYRMGMLDFIDSCDTIEVWYDFTAMYMGMSV